MSENQSELREQLEGSLALEAKKNGEDTVPVEVIQHPSLTVAMAAAQADLTDPQRNREVTVQPKQGKAYKFKYTELDHVLKALRPVLHRHGLWVEHWTKIDGSMLTMCARMRHEGGEAGETCEYPVAGMNSSHQQIGAGMTYARRNLDCMVSGISASDDTDAEGTADLGDGPKQKMSAQQAKQEIDWQAIQDSIDNADTLEKLTNRAKRVEANRGIWPDSYVTSAFDRIQAQRKVLADERMAAATDIDELNGVFSDLEAALENMVPWEELAALHRKHESRLMDEPENPLRAG